MKKQIIVIHGGSSYDTYDQYIADLKEFTFDLERTNRKGWKDNLTSDLGPDYEIIMPEMPNWWNARYTEWKIWFEKILPLLNKEIILIGHSLGGIFLAKYLAENNIKKKILGTFLVAAPFDDKNGTDSLADFVLPKTLKKFSDQSDLIYLYHSTDDPIVPFVDLQKYQDALGGSQTVVFKNRGHFLQETFPELVADIKNILK